MFIFNFFKLFRDIFVYSNFTYFKVDSIGSEIELTAVVPDDTFTVTQAVNALQLQLSKAWVTLMQIN